MTTTLPLDATLGAASLLHLARTGTPQVQAAVASHPNAPAWLLGELGEQWPAEVLSNPALPLLRLADPQLLRHWPARTVERLTAQPDAPPWLLRQAASHPVIDVQLATVVHPDLPEDVLDTLGTSPFWTIREYVARKPALSPALLQALARDVDYSVRLTVAGCPDLPQAVRHDLGRDAHPLVRAIIQLGELSSDQNGD